MKKIAALILALALALTLAACGGTGPAPASGTPSDGGLDGSSVPRDSDGAAISYGEYSAAEIGAEVTVETYVQAKQVWRDGKTSLYTQSEEGAYFIYQLACTRDEYDSLAVGTKLRVTGTKSEWSGETEITDASYEVLDGAFIADPIDLTAVAGGDELAAHRDKMASFRGMTVEAITDKNGKEAAFLYNWDGAGAEGDDLYFNASVDGNTINFTVESDFCGAESSVYKAVKELKVGDVIDITCFLYWYNGPNPHVFIVKPAA